MHLKFPEMIGYKIQTSNNDILSRPLNSCRNTLRTMQKYSLFTIIPDIDQNHRQL